MVLEKPSGKKGEAWRVGLADGRILPFVVDNAAAQRKLALHDVVLVHVNEGKGKTAARAELRVRPQVQGTVIVLENKSGRILAMTGGFSYPLSQLNRATQAVRQPGSAIKPLSYLAALGKGLQPNTLVIDESITLPPVGGGRREQDYWTPKNYDGSSGGILTLRSALENSRNLATVHLLDGGIEKNAGGQSRSAVRACDRGPDLSRMPALLSVRARRAAGAADRSRGVLCGDRKRRLAPDALCRRIDRARWRDRSIVMNRRRRSRSDSVDRAAFYQLKTMLQGVLARGTARSIAGLAPYVAGKTGTSDDENDAWFVGFTNDVTVAVWIGYDNATGKRRTLGGGATGGGVAVPIFEPVMQAVWANVAARTALAPPSPEAKRQLSCRLIDVESGEMQGGAGRPITECFRIDRHGQVVDTQYRLVSRENLYIMRDPRGYYSVEPNPNPFGFNGYYQQRPGYQYYDNSGRHVQPPRDPYRPPGQYHGQPAPQPQPQRREPQVQAPAPRDPYGRQYQQPQPSNPWYLWGDRRSN